MASSIRHSHLTKASATKLAEPFQRNNAYHIREGERLTLAAINRATCYIGSTVFTSGDPAQISEGTTNDINSAIDDIVMAPTQPKNLGRARTRN